MRVSLDMRVDKAGEDETVDLAINNSSVRKALDGDKIIMPVD